MIAFKKNYFLIIENTRDLDLSNIKKGQKFIIIYRNKGKTEKISDLIKYRKECKLRQIKFIVANDLNLIIKLKADGIYLSAHNLSFKQLNYKKLNFYTIGGAHNFKDIYIKKKQGCNYILLSRLFKVSYKPKMNFLGINKFNFLNHKNNKILIPLGGINIENLNKLKIVDSFALASMTEIKKKPTNFISRLF